MDHATRRAKGRTYNNEPTLADQSAAHETELNVILQRYSVSGQAPGSAQQPITGDFTNLPTDLRGFLEAARSADELRKKLPPQLRDKTDDELTNLTMEDLQTIMQPPAPPPAPTPEGPK